MAIKYNEIKLNLCLKKKKIISHDQETKKNLQFFQFFLHTKHFAHNLTSPLPPHLHKKIKDWKK